jgi:hypothetical protein
VQRLFFRNKPAKYGLCRFAHQQSIKTMAQSMRVDLARLLKSINNPFDICLCVRKARKEEPLEKHASADHFLQQQSAKQRGNNTGTVTTDHNDAPRRRVDLESLAGVLGCSGLHSFGYRSNQFSMSVDDIIGLIFAKHCACGRKRMRFPAVGR